MRKTIITLLSFSLLAVVPLSASAHQSGCHRWHSCPSDSGSYVCGDLGYPCQYPTYSTSSARSYVSTTPTYGLTNNKIKLLQQALASDTSLYPEGFVTGNFGNLTKNAVKRFQLKYGLTVDGNIGPKTKAMLNSVYQINL